MSLRTFIQHNFWLKLFSFVLAVIIWLVIQYGIQRDIQFGQNPLTDLATRDSVPLAVAVLTKPGDARVFKVDPEDVIVTLTGESAILNDLTRRDLKAYVDLTDPKQSGESSQRIRLHVPNGVTVLSVLPLAVNVEQISP